MNARKSATIFAFAALAAAGQPAHASGLFGQQIVATFTNPLLAGTIANDPVAGQNSYLNNTTTADYSINNGVVNNNIVSSNINWGQYTGTNTTGFLEDSVLVFVGGTIPANADTTPFSLGGLSFLNGTSDLDTLIFGVTMNFYAGSVAPSNFLGSDNIVITTTSNVFGVPGGLANGDDDYINVCGTFSSICGTSIEAVESSEGGTGLTVSLNGTIVGDPMLNISTVSLVAGQNSTTNGFLGTDPGIGAQPAPEPATWGLALCALLVAGLRLRRPTATTLSPQS